MIDKQYVKFQRGDIIYYINKETDAFMYNYYNPVLEYNSDRKLMLISDFVINVTENAIIKNKLISDLEFMFDILTRIG